jgi:hypothetical protein
MTATRLRLIRLVVLLLVTVSFSSTARIIDAWPYDKLVAESDVVAIVEPIENRPASDAFPDYSYGHSAGDFVATNTQFRVATVFKGDLAAAEATVLHFGYSANVPTVNGAHFVRFAIGPLQYEKRALREGKPTGGVTAFLQQPMWLAFLKQRKDGRFEPVTGHYDAAMSFRELHKSSFYAAP